MIQSVSGDSVSDTLCIVVRANCDHLEGLVASVDNVFANEDIVVGIVDVFDFNI